MPILESLTLLVSSFFSGAAFYITFVEQPARITLDPSNLLQQWKPSYRRGFALQSSLALIAAFLGFAIYILEGNIWWFIGGCLMLVNWPYTFIFIMRINKELLACPLDKAGEEVRRKIIRWEILHRVRVCFGLAACLSFMLARF